MKTRFSMYRSWISALLIGVALGLSGCGDGGEEAADDRPVIGVSVLTLTNPFFRVLSDSLVAEAERNGFNAIVQAGEFDVNRQNNQVSDFIVQGVSAIVLTPVDSRSIVTAIAAANEAGIPVFTADIAVLDSTVEVVSHIATDNYQAGRIAAQALIEALNGEGDIGILDFPEVESVILRTRGFMDELNEQKAAGNATMEVVSRLPSGSVKDRGYRATQDMIQAHPDIRGIFAINDLAGLGAVAALEESGRGDRVAVVAVDGQPEARQAIKAGQMYADAIQHPDEIGKQTVQVIVRYMSGEDVPDEVLIPPALYRQADAMEDPTLE